MYGFIIHKAIRLPHRDPTKWTTIAPTLVLDIVLPCTNPVDAISLA
jgi:hypothetical protein